MKPRVWIPLLLIPFCLLFVPPARYSIAANPPTDPWAGFTLLKHIASCESWGDPNKDPREFNASGTVLRGNPNPDDIGLAQINLPTWGATADQLGFNLYTYEGNLDFAKWLFDHYGDAPWVYSEGCWGKYATQEAA